MENRRYCARGVLMFGLIGPARMAGQSAGAALAFPLSLFASSRGSYLDRTNTATLWQNTAGTIPGATGSVLQRIDDLSGHGYNATEATSPPYLRAAGVACVGSYTLTINFGTSLGSDCTIAIAYPHGGVDILWHQSIGTTYVIPVEFAALLILERAVTVSEAEQLIALLSTKCGTDADDLYFGVQGLGQSLMLGTNTNAAGNAGELVDGAVGVNHDPRAHMWTITGGSADYGPRPHMDALPANNNTSIDTSKLTGLELLTEGINDVAAGKYGETAMTGFIAQFLKDDDYAAQFLVDIHGRGGTPYRELSGAGLEPNTVHWNNGQILQQMARDVVATAGGSYRLLALLNMHGESDAANGRSRANYTADMIDWVDQYNVHRRDGFRTLRPVPMVYNQIANMNPAGAFDIAIAQRDAAAADARLLLAGPKYQYTYSDGTHLRSTSERQAGEMLGKVLRRSLKEGVTWVPLKIRDATRAGAVVSVRFWVPVGALVIDTTLIAAATNYGFEYVDDGGVVTISSVTLKVGTTDTIDVTLSSSSIGANAKLRLAKTQASVTTTGPTNGARTNIRDSDSEVGVLTSAPLYNWAINDEVAVV
jgi:hypothetical protein